MADEPNFIPDPTRKTKAPASAATAAPVAPAPAPQIKQLVKPSSGSAAPVYKRKHEHAEEEGTDAWLMTYADMITLILCFFVIMLSVSEPKKEKFEKLKQQLTGGFIEKVIEAPFKDTFQQFQKIIEDAAVERDVSVDRNGKIITLDMNGSLLFEPGSATLKTTSLPMVENMIRTLAESGIKDYTVEVEGHSDNAPMSSAQFPSNWELSSARAAAVVRLMIEKGVQATRLKASGLADAQPKVPNTDEYGNIIPENQARNRRVVMRIEAK